ncbi:MAG: DNA translocase FtsK [Actinobacteria bacterium]|nr:DNA translocase FtsK [Actinomycetota bacterium]
MAVRSKPARKPTRKTAPRRSPAPKTRARRARPPVQPIKAHHHPELVGLGLVAIGVFLASVLWFGLSGGPAASAATGAIGWAAYLAPLVFCPVGVLVVAKSELVEVRPFRLGLSLALPGLLLAFGSSHGGGVGRLLEAIVALGIGSTGSMILGIVIALAGLLLLSGASLGAIVRRSGHAVRSASVRVRRELHELDVSDPFDDLDPSEETPKRRRRKEAAPIVDGEHDFPDIVSEVVAGVAEETMPARLAPPFNDEATVENLVGDDTQQALFTTESTSPDSDYQLPDRKLLRRSKAGGGPSPEADKRTADALVRCLASFGVDATIVGQVSGPRVTRYELQLAEGTKVGKVANLKDDLSYALATTEIRILAPIPGKQAVGVEVPNLSPKLVTLGDIYDDLPATASPLSVWLGKDISGASVWTDLARMPHLLIAGTTGSGKSGCINAILTSILLRASPDEAKLILIDPKRIELNYYESIPHLLTPVVSSPKEASAVLLNVVTEMERRYERLSVVRARNLPEANRSFRKRGEPELPYLLVVIDELADLMMVSPQDVEDAIIRLAQKSRAVGIHLVLATQRPSVDVITGMIKANVPSRIAFAVSSQTDSRVILDQNGAESLLGQGDMLFKPLGTSRLQRVQGAFVSEDEVALIVEQTRVQREQKVDATFLEAPQVFVEEHDGDDGEYDPDEDALLDRAIEVVIAAQTASVSLLQRRLRVGYTRAGRLIDMLERRGIISAYEGSKPRTVLIGEADLERRVRVEADEVSDL